VLIDGQNLAVLVGNDGGKDLLRVTGEIVAGDDGCVFGSGYCSAEGFPGSDGFAFNGR